MMAKQPKAGAGQFGEPKTCRFQVLFTESGLEILDELAANSEVSRSDCLERLVRAVHLTGKAKEMIDEGWKELGHDAPLDE